ncbi:phosphoglycerate dehydrogenase [Pseudohongiella sp. SYSU M77423]|uniref:phosphoglycerate dehydrogenase n=1 Tax=unclassified Pseudohongiella TaxID=2629611 RepID=UPI000C56805D|nr:MULTISPECIES: phosphoglycerate dehydrogenase [unclassified Pseudohongiella]MAY55038.1 phosphoglycerate dehydrogenase [Gammaproteobacteria bacterium]MEC8859378.1 phosphoglycerate dehydrogenase [Pseudomonadota bacterium]HBN13896.1 phosphoglycerate dehydrogenase [Pseudohongiella sp.]MBJ56315.1 phosphoglycerate dehydrogenase [Gammaproteobacteria bacterium]MDH7944172.1 phosphoglycerate dehydrogenase [Pseudohongiella sp. SYSU M77423]|tara:strand:+ start:368 stop:1597 length:1230 start_codon:yes stop_codon:yes gene_type:complete
MKPTSLDKSKIRFLLLEGVHQSAVKTLHEAGYTNIEYLKTSLSEDDLVEKVKDVHFIGIRSRTQLTARVFEAASKLQAVGCFCIGTNQVDLTAALIKGVPVFNAPYSNTRSVAELVIGQTILLLRGIPEKNALAHRGDWQKVATGSYETRGKKLGLIGYGNIGSQLSVLAESMGMKVYLYDIITKLPLGNAVQVSSLKELMETCDVISLHVPETAQTANMIGAEQLSWMKKGSILINASRGTVVDIDALHDALESGHLAGAAIDVFPVEPRSNEEEFVSPLRKFDNCILTPHIGGSTMEAQENIGLEVSEKLIRYSDNGSTQTSVNFPEVALPSHPDMHRLLHIHENVPGVLSQINSVFSAAGINIRSQYLQTNDKIGYVVMDIDREHSEIAMDKLVGITGTIRCRVLW